MSRVDTIEKYTKLRDEWYTFIKERTGFQDIECSERLDGTWFPEPREKETILEHNNESI